MPFFIVEVALPVPLRRTFDYLPLPDEAIEQYRPGQRVRVEFGRQLQLGIVLGTRTHSDVPQDKLRPLLARLDDTPLLADQDLSLCRWLSEYYHHSLGEVLELFIPTMLRRGSALTEADERVWQRLDVQQEPPLRGSRQQQLWQHFLQQPFWQHSELTGLGFSQAQLISLAEKQLITETLQLPIPAVVTEVQPPHALNDAQQQALTEIQRELHHFRPILLEGITGSGKTEVYLRAIDEVLARGKQALVLVPEIGLTPQTVRRFRERFAVPIALLHSGLNERERLQAWRQACEGKARVLIGTRSAAFTPMPDLGLIILDEEHDGSFKQQDGLRYSARDFSLVRAHRRDIPVVLGSATPSLETLHNALTGKYLHLRLNQRAGNAKAPGMMLHSILHQPLTAGFAQPVLAQMHKHLSQGKQVLVFINRRGYAPLLACQQCGWMAECRRCDARLTLHQSPPHLHCHHCDYQQGIPTTCPQCASQALLHAGQGSEKVEQHLAQLFPDIAVKRVDRDTVRSKQAFDQLYDDIHSGEPCILVGTQMLAKGHHFPDVTLVVVLDADAGLFSSDFRGMEHSAQLICQVAGRAGRAESPGEVWIQTLYADHPQLNLLLDHGYHALALSLLQERQHRQLPPYSHMALLRCEDGDRDKAQNLLTQARAFIQHWLQTQHAKDRHAPVNLLGPMPATMERRNGRFRFQLQLYANERRALHPLLNALVRYLEDHNRQRIRWQLDIDPIDSL